MAAKRTGDGDGDGGSGAGDVPRTLYLVDGTAQLFRAYFAIRGLTNDDGLPTNATFGFTSMLRKLLVDRKPDAIAVAWDLPGDVFRHESFPDYKANRPPAPEDLNVQVPYAKEVCDALGVRSVEQASYEADDLIATYAHAARAEGWKVVVVASDKDLLQLVEDGIDVYNPTKDVQMDAEGVREQFGTGPEYVRDVLGLQGDSVDNIPGVPGVGGKTALGMVNTYGHVDDVIARAGRFVALFDARDALVEAIDAAAARKAKPLGEAAAGALADAARAFAGAAAAFVANEADADYRDRVAEAAAALGEAADADALAAASETAAKDAVKPLRPVKTALKALDKGSARKIWYAVHEHAAQARLSKELATLHAEVPLAVPLAELGPGTPDRPRAHALFRSLGFRTLTKEFAPDGDAEANGAEADGAETGGAEAGGADDGGGAGKAGGAEAEEAGGAGTAGAKPAKTSRGQGGLFAAADYVTVTSAKELKAQVAACRAAGRFAVDTETDSTQPMLARLVGISLSAAPGSGCYVPVGHDYAGAPEQLDLATVARELGPLLADPAVGKIGQNLKYDAHVLRRHGMPVEGWALDTMVAAFLLHSSRASYGMDALAGEYLGYTPIPYESIAGKGAKQKTLNEVEIERVAEYAAEDADVTLRLARVFEERLESARLRELYDTIDGPVLPVLIEMEAHGIRVDAAVLERMSGEMETALAADRAEIHRLAGGEFNVDSPKQLREVLFEKLGLKPRRKTAKSRVASTDAQTLEELAADHPIAARLLEYRERYKLKSTYVDTLPKLIHPETGRVHTSYHPTGAATGRLSSSDPNLQNIPARTEAGRKIRSAFVPEDGYLFLAADYSQVELRVLAHMAEDPELIAAFRAGDDIHRYTAARVFGVKPADVDGTMRTRAKAVNFGILYGMSETRLAREQGMTRDDARTFIAAYFERFAAVRRYIDEVRERALRDAAVRTLFGRVRHFPQLHQRVHRGIQEQALRAALNTTIQGTAADLMKMAMLRAAAALRDAGSGARMLLQVHDELLFEVPDTELKSLGPRIREAMEGVHPLRVPLSVDVKTGPSWEAVT